MIAIRAIVATGCFAAAAASQPAVPEGFRLLTIDFSKARHDPPLLAGLAVERPEDLLRLAADDFSRPAILPEGAAAGSAEALEHLAALGYPAATGAASEVYAGRANEQPGKFIRLPPEGPARIVWTMREARPADGLVAAWAASAAIHVAQSRLEGAFLRPPGGALVDANGRWRPEVQAVRLAAWLAETPFLVPVEGAGRGYEALAGRSASGGFAAILAVRFKGEDAARGERGFLAAIENLPWGNETFRAERYRLDSQRGGELSSRGSGRGGRYRVVSDLAEPGVELILLYQDNVPPGASIVRRRSGRTR